MRAFGSPSRRLLCLIPREDLRTSRNPRRDKTQIRLVSNSIDRDCDDSRLAQDDRSKIDRQSTEYSKSGTDDAVANQETSFDPRRARNPEEARDEIDRKGTRYKPLNVSPANPSVSSDAEGQYRVKRKDGDKRTTTTYHGNPSMKIQSTGANQEKVYAGSDTRKSKKN